MALDIKHIRDMNAFTDVLYNIFNNNTSGYKTEPVGGGHYSAYVVPRLSNCNVDYLRLNLYALMGLMNGDAIIDGLDEEKLSHAMKTGEFFIREYNPHLDNARAFISKNITYKDLMYAKEIVLRKAPFKLSLKRKENSFMLLAMLDAGRGFNIEKVSAEHALPGKGSKNLLKTIRNCLAHNDYSFNGRTVYIDRPNVKLNFDINWLRGLSEFLFGYQSCNVNNIGEYNTIHLPILPEAESGYLRNYAGLLNHLKEGRVIKVTLLKPIDMMQSRLYDALFYDSRRKKAFTIEEKMEFYKTAFKELEVSEKDYKLEVLTMPEVYSNFRLENIASRIAQEKDFFKRPDHEKINILHSLFIYNQSDKILNLPSTIGSGIIATMQGMAECMMPANQNIWREEYVERLAKSQRAVMHSPLFNINSLPQIIKTKEMLLKENADAFFVPIVTDEWFRTEGKHCAVVLQAYNALINSSFVDDVCSRDPQTDIFSMEDIKLVENLDMTKFKFARVRNFTPDAFKENLNHRGKFWENVPTQSPTGSFDVKSGLLNQMRAAIAHGTVSFLYGVNEKSNEIAFFTYRKDNVTQVVKCGVDEAFKFFKNPVFMQETKTRQLIEKQKA